jgi:hypothetical protein
VQKGSAQQHTSGKSHGPDLIHLKPSTPPISQDSLNWRHRQKTTSHWRNRPPPPFSFYLQWWRHWRNPQIVFYQWFLFFILWRIFASLQKKKILKSPQQGYSSQGDFLEISKKSPYFEEESYEIAIFNYLISSSGSPTCNNINRIPRFFSFSLFFG